jgi:hypothetical protein
MIPQLPWLGSAIRSRSPYSCIGGRSADGIRETVMKASPDHEKCRRTGASRASLYGSRKMVFRDTGAVNGGSEKQRLAARDF